MNNLTASDIAAGSNEEVQSSLGGEVMIGESESSAIEIDGKKINARAVPCGVRGATQVASRVRAYSFYVTDINWRAGAGHPTYTTYCPHDGPGGGMGPPFKKHQIVSSCSGRWFSGCVEPGGTARVEGSLSGPAYFGVNDEKLDDNDGSFIVHIFDEVS